MAVFPPSPPGQHIRRIGEDIETGTQLLAEGHRLGPRDIGLLAAIGLDKVMVRPRPRVVVISGGLELVEPGMPIDASQNIYDSNSCLLAAAARAPGVNVFHVGLVAETRGGRSS